MLFNEIRLPVQKRSKERLELVIHSTIQILEQQGIHACTIPEIASVAQLPKINIYQYFPTVNHLFSIMVKRYLDELKGYMAVKSEAYMTCSTRQITHDLIAKVVQFYHANKAASVLILGGPVHVDGFNLQEMVIEEIADDLRYIFFIKTHALHFKNQAEAVYLIEMVFALMKHSFYKFGSITADILQECLMISDLYLEAKGHHLDE